MVLKCYGSFILYFILCYGAFGSPFNGPKGGDSPRDAENEIISREVENLKGPLNGREGSDSPEQTHRGDDAVIEGLKGNQGDSGGEIKILHGNQDDSGSEIKILHGNQNDSGGEIKILHGNQENSGGEIEVLHSNQNDSSGEIEILHGNHDDSGSVIEIFQGNQNDSSGEIEVLHGNHDDSGSVIEISHGSHDHSGSVIEISHGSHEDSGSVIETLHGNQNDSSGEIEILDGNHDDSGSVIEISHGSHDHSGSVIEILYGNHHDSSQTKETDEYHNENQFVNLKEPDDNSVIKLPNDLAKMDFNQEFFDLFSHGNIPYYINYDSYDESIDYLIRKAMNEIQDNSCLIFERIRGKDVSKYGKAFVHFGNPTRTRECVHTIMRGLKEEPIVVLGYDCMSEGQVLHAIMHVIGFRDEVTHPYRDKYITVLWSNVQKDHKHLFDFDSKWFLRGELQYDYRSIMHFQETEFSANGGNTVVTVDKNNMIRPSNTLSEIDKKRLRRTFEQRCYVRNLRNCKQDLKNNLSQKLKGYSNETLKDVCSYYEIMKKKLPIYNQRKKSIFRPSDEDM